MPLDYTLLDVFTDQPFGGNPLAVFPDGRKLSDAVMQRLARELNLSETTFVLPPTVQGATHRVRIFTPGEEVPFAGHPTVGTAVLLAMREQPEAREVRFVFEERVGLVPVRVTRTAQGWSAELTAAMVPQRLQQPDAAAVADALGLSLDELVLGTSAPAVWTCGLPFTFVRVRSLEALARAALRAERWSAHPAARVAPMVYPYTVETGDASVQVRSRMFAPELGVPEDPATGSAASALAGVLGAAGALPEGTQLTLIHQGVEMGRTSVLRLTTVVSAGAIIEVRVAGAAVRMGEGRFAELVSTSRS